MSPSEELSFLVGQITDWLVTAPSDEDIIAYAKGIPEENYELLEYVGTIWLESAFEIGSAPFSGEGSNVSALIDGIGRVELIRALGKYNAASVVRTYQKQYPTLAMQVDAPAARQASQLFSERWRVANSLMAAPRYVARLVHAHSALSASSTQDRAAQIEAVIQSVLSFDEKATAEGRELYPDEVVAQKNALLSLGLFPAEYLDWLFDPVRYREKSEFLAAYAVALRLIQELGLAAFKADPAYFDRAMWTWVVDRQEIDSLKYLQITYRPVSPQEKQMTVWLAQHWGTEAIRTQAIVRESMEFAEQLSSEQLEVFKRETRVFLASSPLAETIAEPLNVKYMLHQLDEHKGRGSLASDLLLRSAPDIADEPRRQLAINMFDAYVKIMEIQNAI